MKDSVRMKRQVMDWEKYFQVNKGQVCSTNKKNSYNSTAKKKNPIRKWVKDMNRMCRGQVST